MKLIHNKENPSNAFSDSQQNKNQQKPFLIHKIHCVSNRAKKVDKLKKFLVELSEIKKIIKIAVSKT